MIPHCSLLWYLIAILCQLPAAISNLIRHLLGSQLSGFTMNSDLLSAFLSQYNLAPTLMPIFLSSISHGMLGL